MAKQTSKGKCNLCGETFGKSGMTKHLATCKQKSAAEKPSRGRRSKKKPTMHLVVEGRDLPGYWMHLEVPTRATLEDLDDFLRDTWVECCGHLSAFTIEGVSYSASGGGSGLFGEMEDEDMDVTLEKILSPGMKFYYEYDFGTTTELALKVIAVGEGEVKGKSIKILARNEPPPITCEVCGKPATQVCTECIWSGEGWLCDDCAEEHECGEDMLLPVVNSPRVGMCGYAG